MAAKTVKEDFASRQKQLNDQLRNGDLRRVYLLGGEQAYLRLQNRDKLVRALLGDGDAMNLSKFHGSGASAREIIDMAQTLPFFADRRVIVLENTGLMNPKSVTRSSAGGKTQGAVSEESAPWCHREQFMNKCSRGLTGTALRCIIRKIVYMRRRKRISVVFP